MKNILLIIICIVALSIIACRSMLDEITPANISQQSIEYAEVEHQILPTLAEAKRIRSIIIIKHRGVQIDLKRFAQDDVLFYQDALGFIDAAIAESSHLQDVVVGSEDQPFSILGILAGLSGGTFIGSRFIKRRGDYSPTEHAVEIEKVKNGKA